MLEAAYLNVNMSTHAVEYHSPGDGSIDVGDDYLVVPVPEVDGSLTATGSLVLSGHTEHNVVRTVLQLEGHLCVCDRSDISNKSHNNKWNSMSVFRPNSSPAAPM